MYSVFDPNHFIYNLLQSIKYSKQAIVNKYEFFERFLELSVHHFDGLIFSVVIIFRGQGTIASICGDSYQEF